MNSHSSFIGKSKGGIILYRNPKNSLIDINIYKTGFRIYGNMIKASKVNPDVSLVSVNLTLTARYREKKQIKKKFAHFKMCVEKK